MNGKYVIRMGKYYVSEVIEKTNSVDIILEKDLRDVKITRLEQAEIIKDKIGGKILKINSYSQKELDELIMTGWLDERS